jgi:UDPglucose--hexose-1-phosphate uridylyltransferase
VRLHRRELRKPDGRPLVLYGDEPVTAEELPGSLAVAAGRPHLRWHPLRGEWVAYAGHRQDRTFRPPPDFDPLAPTRDPARPTEVPAGRWQVAVFENRFPALASGGEAPDLRGFETRPSGGTCEVVVYAQEPELDLARLPIARIELLLRVWADRTTELGRRDDVAYVMPFENRGAEAGATLPHAHGQIYAYPFVPPVPARELELQERHLARTGRGLLEDLVAAEESDGRRVLQALPRAISFLPAYARYAYEVWVAPRRRAAMLSDLEDDELTDLAAALQDVVRRLDGAHGAAMPYVLVVHQGAVDGRDPSAAHVHVELYPPHRSRDRLKVLAGTELGAGMLTNDSIPEERAAELRAVTVEPPATAESGRPR